MKWSLYRLSYARPAGFPDFKMGDGVKIVHKKEGIEAGDYTGYVIGLHEREVGTVAEVWALDLDQLEMDLIDQP